MKDGPKIITIPPSDWLISAGKTLPFVDVCQVETRAHWGGNQVVLYKGFIFEVEEALHRGCTFAPAIPLTLDLVAHLRNLKTLYEWGLVDQLHRFETQAQRDTWVGQGPEKPAAPGFREKIAASNPTVKATLKDVEDHGGGFPHKLISPAE